MSVPNFEHIVIDRMTETCERLAKLEQKVTDYIDMKVAEINQKETNKTDKFTIMTVLFAGISGTALIISLFHL